MLDPLSALGLASSVVQLVDFGSKFVLEAYGAYESVQGVSQDVAEIEFLSRDLEALNARIATSSKAQRDDAELTSIAQRCQGVARELSLLLADLRVKGAGPMRSWDAVRQTVRKVWKQDKIEKLQRRLDALRENVTTRLIVILRTDQSILMQSVQDLIAKNNEMKAEHQVFLADLRKDLLASLQQAQRVDEDLRKNTKNTEKYQSAAQKRESCAQSIIRAVDDMNNGARMVATANTILHSLIYPEMRNRDADIREAYSETFEWIFGNHSSHFRTWLEHGSGLFWVNGKAGSGKSTLMKFLAGHSQTRDILKTRARQEGLRLTLGSFYFWNSGFPMQRKQEGLLQSLLFQILRQLPHLIEDACPQRWTADDRFHDAPHPWTRRELLDALDLVSRDVATRSSTFFLFFIDGLDEYEGDPAELIELVGKLTQIKSAQICVSSRPWTEFHDAYGNDDRRLLVLQDLTRPDMHRFVHGMLGENERFIELRQRDSRAQDLIAEILDKAQGVFLWVFLVVRSLLRGLSKHDDISVLQRRLRTLPSDLQDYFKHMMDSIEPVYRDPAFRLLLLAVQAEDPLPLATVCYVEQQTLDLDPALGDVAQIFKSDELEGYLNQASLRVNAWCRDLLEVDTRASFVEVFENLPYHHHLRYVIGFLHRTVRDFMRQPETQTWLESHVYVGFDTRWALVGIRVFLLKSIPISPPQDRKDYTDSFMAIFFDCCLNAVRYESALPGATPTALVNELGRVWDQACVTAQRSRETRDWPDAPFLYVVASYGLTRYVQLTLDTTPEVLEPKLLHAVLQRIVHTSPKNSMLELRPAMQATIELLLARGADPNERLSRGDRKSLTPWKEFLAGLDRGGTSDDFCFTIALLLLRHGAHADVSVATMRSKRSLVECLQHIYFNEDPAVLASKVRAASKEADTERRSRSGLSRSLKKFWQSASRT